MRVWRLVGGLVVCDGSWVVAGYGGLPYKPLNDDALRNMPDISVTLEVSHWLRSPEIG